MNCIKKRLILLPLICLPIIGIRAQQWYIGAGVGAHGSALRYSNFNEKYYSGTKLLGSPLVSLFGQVEFGKQQNFAIRPEISYLQRGGLVLGPANGINQYRYYYNQQGDIVRTRQISALKYSLRVNYFDVRIPLIYQFLKKDSKFRPYVYVAPVLGFAFGGSINMETSFYDDVASDVDYTDVSKSNMQVFQFAAQFGAGVKYAIPIAGERCYLGLDICYELGLTDTYSSDETQKYVATVPLAKPLNVYQNSRNYNLYGTRKMHGFDIQVNFSVPINIFKRKQKQEVPIVISVAEPIAEPVTEQIEETNEKPCMSLEEINDMIKNNISVRGKKICAIDDVIQFDFNKSIIKPISYNYLDTLAETLKQVQANVKICGHTDNIGSDEYNMKLSEERALAVMKYLIKRGVSAFTLTCEGFGESKPIADNSTEIGRKKNRRVEFEIAN